MKKNTKITCGIFLLDKNNRILIGHPTKHPANVWSIPKGRQEDNEQNHVTALREFEEETGVNLLKLNWCGKMDLIGEFKYPNKKKKLIAYRIRLKNQLDISKFHCDSMVPKEIYGEEVPELDEFKWVDKDETMNVLHETQKNALDYILT